MLQESRSYALRENAMVRRPCVPIQHAYAEKRESGIRVTKFEKTDVMETVILIFRNTLVFWKNTEKLREERYINRKSSYTKVKLRRSGI